MRLAQCRLLERTPISLKLSSHDIAEKMLYGLYLSAQGAQVQSLRQDVLANNLANANTPAFKRDLLQVQFHSQKDAARGGKPSDTIDGLRNLTGGVTAGSVVTDFRTGSIQATGKPLDVAITGKGFLQVVDGRETYLTRDGRLSVRPDGTLVTSDHGLPLLGADGNPIANVDPSLDLVIGTDGTLSQNGLPVNQLKVVQPSSSANLEKAGRNLLINNGPEQAAADASVLQGHLEQSGVNPITEMVDMIEASRTYEANVNMIKYQDDSLGRLLASAGRK